MKITGMKDGKINTISDDLIGEFCENYEVYSNKTILEKTKEKVTFTDGSFWTPNVISNSDMTTYIQVIKYNDSTETKDCHVEGSFPLGSITTGNNVQIGTISFS